MAKKSNFLWGVVFALVVFALVLVVLSFVVRPNGALQKTQLPVRLLIADKTGFNVTNDTLDFGKLTVATSGFKRIFLRNTFSETVHVVFGASGNVSALLRYEPEVVLAPGENVTYTIYTKTIEHEPMGFYSGTFDVVFLKV